MNNVFIGNLKLGLTCVQGVERTLIPSPGVVICTDAEKKNCCNFDKEGMQIRTNRGNS
jgi:hypothetical protein